MASNIFEKLSEMFSSLKADDGDDEEEEEEEVSLQAPSYRRTEHFAEYPSLVMMSVVYCAKYKILVNDVVICMQIESSTHLDILLF